MIYVERHTRWQRFIHGLTALLMVLLMLSGLAFFHPALAFLSGLFGGGTWNRILHPWLGVLLTASFVLLFLRFVADNLWKSEDSQWLGRLGAVLGKRHAEEPPAGRYNAGEKLVFWAMTLWVALLFISGIALWDAYFGSDFSMRTRRLAADVHAISAWLAILFLIIHVYAAIWVRGTMRSMTDGRVSAGWARKHHRKWFDELASKETK